MKKNRVLLGVSLVCLSIILVPSFGQAEVGVTDTTIKIGNITDTTGPIAAYGLPRVEATNALFKHINDTGGIHGRKLILAHESDGYRPPNTVMAFKKLVEIDQVFAFIGSLGVATIMAIVPEIERRKVPYVTIGGNSAALFNPPKRYIFGVWASYDDFGRIQVDYVAHNFKMPNARIAHIMQDDETGKDNHRGIVEQVKKYPGMQLVSHEKFKRGTVDVSAQVANMRRANVDAVLMSPIFVSSAMIAKEIQKIGWAPKMVLNSSSGSPLLIKLGGTAVEGAVVQVGQRLLEDDYPGIKFYKDTVQKYYPDSKYNPSQYGSSGFYEVMVAIEGLRRAGRDLTRESYVDAMETFDNYDVGGAIAPVTFGKNIRQGTHAVIYVKVQDGKFVNETGWISPR